MIVKPKMQESVKKRKDVTNDANGLGEDFTAGNHVQSPELDFLAVGEDEDEVNGVNHWEFRPINCNECDFAVIQNGVRDNDLKHLDFLMISENLAKKIYDKCVYKSLYLSGFARKNFASDSHKDITVSC